MADAVLASPPLAAPPLGLADIRQPVDADLKEFRRYFREAMRSKVDLLDRVTQFVLRQKGKQIRPILVLLSAKLCGEVSDTSYRAAALVELLHTATLVHDDVVDEAERRRGVFSINALWKNKVAVLFGDFLLSRGLLLALDNDEHELLHVVSDAVRRMSEGELLQIEKARRLDIDEATYFRIISDKTASLISACMACGAVSVDADAETVAQVRQIGEQLGLAFQIRDDLFDYGNVDVGKPLGIDLQEKKMTLPLIVALERAEPAERKRILRIVKKRKKSRSDIKTVVAFVQEQGGIAYARSKMESLAADAAETLRTFPASDAREALIGLAAYIVARKK
ncbi:MAG: polyprenyl synthetase family protein [Rhodothermaceae bacterium]|nr:polyprenyl synthetase family protein [Rhodothermaceae bacterium]